MTGKSHLPNLLYLGVACLMIATGGATPSFATVRAVLVGVSDYTYLDADLDGPRNDLRLISDALVTRGVETANIQVLGEVSDGLNPEFAVQEPTKLNILSAFQSALDQSVDGDTVVFYFSGHGSQAPDQNGDEQGGFDEIFLPSDAKAWNGSVGAVENAILDDEFNILARQALGKGLKLVVFIDACHSATGFRQLGGRGRARYLDPKELGLPKDEPSAANPSNAAPLQGDFVFLYSSQSNQRSFEYPLSEPSDKTQWYGDFSRNLAHVLKTEPDLSYESLLQSTTRALRKTSGQFAQTPDGEGPLMSSTVFGSDAGLSQRIVVEKGKLKAGLLSNITMGSRVAVFETAVSDTPLGYALITEAAANTASLTPEAGAVLPKSGFAEIVDAAPAPALRFALTPDVFDMMIVTDYAELAGKLNIAGVEFAPDGQDGTLVVADENVVLVGPDGILDGQGPGSSLRLAHLENRLLIFEIAKALDRYARTQRLLSAVALAAAAKKPGFSLLSPGVKVSVEQKFGTQNGSKCRLDKSRSPQQVTGASSPADHCDQIWITLENSTTKMQDVTVLYIDRDNRITALWPADNLSNRLPSAEEKRIGFRIENPVTRTKGAVAVEKLLVLSVAARAGDQRTVLTGLADTDATRAIGRGAAYEMLATAMDPDLAGRALPLGGNRANVQVKQFDFVVAPQKSNE